MSEPTLKDIWAGMAMMALVIKYRGMEQEEIALEAWELAEALEKAKGERDGTI